MTDNEAIKQHLAAPKDIVVGDVILGCARDNEDRFPEVCIVCREKGIYPHRFWSLYNFSLCEQHKGYTFPFGGNTFQAITPEGDFVDVNLF